VILSPQLGQTTVAAGQAFEVTAQVTDNLSGVSSVCAEFEWTDDRAGFGPSNCGQRISGTALDGIWRVSVNIPQYQPGGVIVGRQIRAHDVAGNRVEINAPTQPIAGWTVTVTSETPGCSPRPKIAITNVRCASGQMRTTITATGIVNGADNTLRQVTFGDMRNVTVQLSGVGAVQSGQVVPLTAGAQTATFTLTRTATGQDVFVPFTVVDGCGPWPSFVGAGAGAL